jgi:glycosyltransferase involved in cell wall biosynthesis
MSTQGFDVSVIVSVYNGEDFLPEALHSIRQQDCHPMEILVVDDGSTDGTARIAADFKDGIRYVHQPNQGPAAARNHGLRLARGEVICFLDADDLWPTDKLARQLAFTGAPPVWREVAAPWLSFLLGSAVFRRRVFEKVGVFDETLRYGEDHDWFLRARESGASLLVMPEVALLYRLHAENMTHGKNAVDLQFLRVLKRSLDRRRQNAPGVAQSLPSVPSSGAMGTLRVDSATDRRKE